MPHDLAAPASILHRISFAPTPLAFPPWPYVGRERFDDPSLRPDYRVLYTGTRRACYYETLSDLRARRFPHVANRGIVQSWFDQRRIGTLRLDESSGPQKWLDLTSPVTFYDFDDVFADLLLARGVAQFDVSTATSRDRELSQAIGRWAFDRGYHGIEYMSRHGAGLTCWAIFEGTPFVVHDVGSPIDRADPDLLEVVRTWNIKLPDAFGTR